MITPYPLSPGDILPAMIIRFFIMAEASPDVNSPKPLESADTGVSPRSFLM